MAETTPSLASEPLAHPPRIDDIGNDPAKLASVMRSLLEYLYRIYKKLEIDGRFATTDDTTGLPDGFTEGSTVDPSTATITTAQTTANQALTNANAAAALAAANDTRLDAVNALGVLSQSISNPPTQAEVENIQNKINDIINAVA